MIILFKVIITSNYFLGIYILMSNNNKILYDIVFKYVKNIITQYSVYNIEIENITTDNFIFFLDSLIFQLYSDLDKFFFELLVLFE